MIIAGGILFENRRHPVVENANQTQQFSEIGGSAMNAVHSLYARIISTEDCADGSVPTPKQQVQ